MIWEIVPAFLREFLNKFIGRPSPDFSGTWPLDLIVRSEAIHFLFSLLVGWLAFSLIWIILSSDKHKWSDRSIFRFGLVCALAVGVTTHIFIDGFTTWA